MNENPGDPKTKGSTFARNIGRVLGAGAGTAIFFFFLAGSVVRLGSMWLPAAICGGVFVGAFALIGGCIAVWIAKR